MNTVTNTKWKRNEKLIFKTETGREVEVNSCVLRDGGTYVEFEAYYLDTCDDITDNDYYYIQDNYGSSLDELAREGY